MGLHFSISDTILACRMQQPQEVILNYELLLRPFESGDGFSRADVLKSLNDTGFEINKEKPVDAVFELKNDKLRAREFIREDVGQETNSDFMQGLNLSIALGSSRLDADMAVSKVFELAQQLGSLVFDPQVGRQVNPSDHDMVLETWHRSAGFQADVVGSVVMGGDAPELSGYKDKPQSRMGLYLLGIIVLLSVVYIARRCSGVDDTRHEAYVNDFNEQGGDK